MHELDVENFDIELIENYPCNDVYELRAREGYYIREIGTLNKYVAGRTHQECVNIYSNKNIDKWKEYIKRHHNEPTTCNICGCQVKRSNIPRHQRTNKCKSHTKPIENNLMKWNYNHQDEENQNNV